MFLRTIERLRTEAGNDEFEPQISLHGLGFLQIKLAADQRLHVWHPDLPRRACFRDSAIHDHRWGFSSRVLVGEQINVLHAFDFCIRKEEASHIGYSHDGARQPSGNRPWTPLHRMKWLGDLDRQSVLPGETYHMRPYVFHSTEAGGDGRVATLLSKTSKGGAKGATSTCRVGVTPDAGFNRLQLSPEGMWAFVADVLF